MTNKVLSKQSAFTIVELLVVIVVIGILATITIVSYTGITQKAKVASIQSDLTNSSKLLKMYYTEYGSYPTNTLSNASPCPTTPTPSTKHCLKLSAGNSIDSYTGNASTFNLNITNGTSKYVITENTSPAVASNSTTPGVPTALTTGTMLTNSITFTWTAPSNNGGSSVTGYKIYRGSTSGSETLYASIGNVLTYTDSAADCGTSWAYKVKAVNSIGESEFSNEIIKDGPGGICGGGS